MKRLREGCHHGCRSRAWLAVVGGILVHLSLGTFYTFGNMNPYITSYIRARSSPSDLSSESTTWILAIQMSVLCILMSLGGFVQQKLGTPVTTLLGSMLTSCSIVVTYFAIQSSFAIVLLTYGFLFSLGEAIAYTPPLFCALKWHPERKGLIGGLTLAGYGSGAFFFNQIQTAFVNPENLKVDPTDGYFKQPELLDRVPFCFLVVGGICASLQLLGTLLIRDPPKTDPQQLIGGDPINHGSGISIDSAGHLEDNLLLPPTEVDGESGEYQESTIRDYTPAEMLKSVPFYILVGICSCLAQGLFYISSLYKVYGQTFINDDDFLALVGSFSSVANGGGRIIWGLITDRTSFKATAVLSCGCGAFFALTLIASPLGGKPMFFIWICMIFFSFAAFTSVLPAACTKTFGNKYDAINYGLLVALPGVSALIPAFLASKLIDVIGWFGIFSLTGGFSFIALLLSIVFNVKDKDGHDI